MIQHKRNCPYAQFRLCPYFLVDIGLGDGVAHFAKAGDYLFVEPVNLIVAGDCALTAIFNL